MGMYEIDTYSDESDPSPDIDMQQFFKQVFKKKLSCTCYELQI